MTARRFGFAFDAARTAAPIPASARVPVADGIAQLRAMRDGEIWRRLSPVTRRAIEDSLSNRDVLTDAQKHATVRAISNMVAADFVNFRED